MVTSITTVSGFGIGFPFFACSDDRRSTGVMAGRTLADRYRARERGDPEATAGAGGRLGVSAAQPGTVISCHSPPLRLRLLPKAWPGAVSPT
jgi:hypothetical protein